MKDVKKKVALITGITGQDGSYLAEFLLATGLRSAWHQAPELRSFNTQRIEHLYQDPHHRPIATSFLHHGDLTDPTAAWFTSSPQVQPDEIYNLGAQSHVAVSFEQPEYTADVDALGTLRLLEAIRILGLDQPHPLLSGFDLRTLRFSAGVPQTEQTAFYPRSPYGVAKLYAHWITVNYRESYGMYACNGILFNHESPVAGETFVTRKITRALSPHQARPSSRLYLGNLFGVARLGTRPRLC